MKTTKRELATAKALAHPIRVAILRVVDAEADQRGRSPAEIARELDVALGTVSYHMGVLRSTGAVRQTRTRRVRGATEHFFRSTGKVALAGDDGEALDKIAKLLGREDMSERVIDLLTGIHAIVEGTGRRIDRAA